MFTQQFKLWPVFFDGRRLNLQKLAVFFLGQDNIAQLSENLFQELRTHTGVSSLFTWCVLCTRRVCRPPTSLNEHRKNWRDRICARSGKNFFLQQAIDSQHGFKCGESGPLQSYRISGYTRYTRSTPHCSICTILLEDVREV